MLQQPKSIQSLKIVQQHQRAISRRKNLPQPELAYGECRQEKTHGLNNRRAGYKRLALIALYQVT